MSSFRCYTCTLITHHCLSNVPPSQVCDVLRALERSTERLKAHIDQLFAVLLEQDPSLMEGLPRIQQGSGLDMDLLSVASMTEVVQHTGTHTHTHIAYTAYTWTHLVCIVENNFIGKVYTPS